MKNLAFTLATLFSVATLSSVAFAQEVSLGEFELPAGSTKEIVVPTSSSIKVGWEITMSFDEAKRCKNSCIELSSPHDEMRMSSKFGGALAFEPKDGKVVATLKNLEDFPIGVKVYKKPS